MATSDFITSRRSIFEPSSSIVSSAATTPTPVKQNQSQRVFRDCRTRSEKFVKNQQTSVVIPSPSSYSENCSRVGTLSSTTSSICSSINGIGPPSTISARRRSMSPLFAPIIGSNYSGRMTPALLERNKMDPNFPQTEEECLYLFHEKIIWNQEKSLLPLAHDLADWLNTLLEIPYITPGNLMEKLESGLILCQLAKYIEEKAFQSDLKDNLPKLKGKIRYNAPVGSFFARDNIAIFINFCKELGVHSNLLFETEDLVSHGEIRNVLVCLLEVGRKAVKYGVDPPMLVTLEHQIENEVAAAAAERDSQHETETGTTNTTTDEESQDDEINKENRNGRKSFVSSSVQANILLSDSTDSGLHVDDETTSAVIRPTELEIVPKSELDIKVSEVARRSGSNCHCVEDTRANFKLRKLSEGKYVINGRTVFVRLLKGIHVMVRVGGGWETFEEFLVRNDPCRARRSRPASACATPVGTGSNCNVLRQPFGYACTNNTSKKNVTTARCGGDFNGMTPNSSTSTLYNRKGHRPVSSPPVMMSKTPATATTNNSNYKSRHASGNFTGFVTPISSRSGRESRHSSRNSMIT